MIKSTLAALACLTLLACTTALPPADPARSQQLGDEAIALAGAADYPAALEKFGEAIRYAPQDSDLYRRKAEIEETLRRFDAAAATYATAEKRLPEDDPALASFRYRYGLLLARIGAFRDARKRLSELDDPAAKTDLDGFITLNAGDAKKALDLFSQAIESTADRELQARIYYHASLAHARLGDPVESRKALFHAVNNARGLALKQHIRILFETLR